MQAVIGSPRMSRVPIDPQLYKAAREGDINLLENYLRAELEQLQQPDVPIQVANGGPQLHWMANNGNRNPLLHRAALQPDEGGPVPNRQFDRLLGVTYSGDTALHIAAYFGHLQVAIRICNANRSLLLRGNNKSETPLHYAAQAGKVEIVAKFIEVAREAQQIQNVLQPEGIDVLTELLSRRNQDGETALYQAVRNKHSAVVRKLIGEDPHLAIIPDNNNVSPLYVAAWGNSLEIVNSLIGSLQGAMSPVAYSGPDGKTALHAAASGERGIVQQILNWKPHLATAKDDTGSTPLHYAASDNNIDAVQSLLENDKTPAYIADQDGLFPVHVAAKHYLKVLSLLFELCPDSDELLDGQGRNFLHVAVENRKWRVVWWARNNNRVNRSVNAKDYEGNTPMHLAVKARHLEIFAVLLECKTLDLDIVNKEGLTPFGLAAAQIRYSMQSLLGREVIIRQTLIGLRSREATRRLDQFTDKYKLALNHKMENEAGNYENLAKSTSTVAVLIASASFAGIFTVSGDYTAHFGNQSSGLNLVFKAFIITVAYAFICSLTATGLSMKATMIYNDPIDRRTSYIGSTRLVHSALSCIGMAFAFGGYVILTPLSKSLAILICLTGGVVPILIAQIPWASIMILWALMRSIGRKEFSWRGTSRMLLPLIDQFLGTLYYGFIIVLIVILCSLFDISRHFLVLVCVIVIPLSCSILAQLFHIK